MIGAFGNFGAAMRRAREERGVEAAAMLIVLPVLVVLVLALIDVGQIVRTRMLVENVARDTARQAAADGGNYNPRTNTTGREWSRVGYRSLYADGSCTFSACRGNQKPVIDCETITRPNGSTYRSNVAGQAGDLITCNVSYPYKPINGPLLNSPFGLGFGSLLKPFDVSASARAETGCPSGVC